MQPAFACANCQFVLRICCRRRCSKSEEKYGAQSPQEARFARKVSMSTTDSIIGTATPRIDGPLKTTGAAEYAADFHFDRMVHAVPVISSIASGRIRQLDT